MSAGVRGRPWPLHTPGVTSRRLSPDTLGPPPLRKYVLLQLPGFALAAGALALLVLYLELSPRLAALLLLAWVVKDAVLYPLVRTAYEPGHPDGAGALLGALGIARERLDPEGYVRVGAELWRASVADEHRPIEAGAAVRVVAVQALTLRVEPA